MLTTKLGHWGIDNLSAKWQYYLITYHSSTVSDATGFQLEENWELAVGFINIIVTLSTAVSSERHWQKLD